MKPMVRRFAAFQGHQIELQLSHTQLGYVPKEYIHLDVHKYIYSSWGRGFTSDRV